MNKENVMNMDDFKLSSFVMFVIMFKSFLAIWLLFMTHAYAEFITFFSTSDYYFTSNIDREGNASVTVAIMIGALNHLGSFALGSLIQPIIMPFMFLIKCISDYNSESKPIKWLESLGNSLMKFNDGALICMNKNAFAY